MQAPAPLSPVLVDVPPQDKHNSPPHTPKAEVHAHHPDPHQQQQQKQVPRAPVVWNSNSKKDPTKVTILNIFDFDGTLFRSPVPNRNMWQMTTWGQIEGKSDGGGIGWYQDVLTLSPPYVPEKPDDSWFVVEVLNEVKKSIADPNALTVLLTGRSTDYKNVLETMLVHPPRSLCFDYMGLKNTQEIRTIIYKNNFIEDIVKRHPTLSEIHIWEDRTPHVLQFREILSTQFPKLKGHVHPVNEDSITLPPALERELVLKLIEKNSKEPKEVLFVPDYSGVEIDEEDARKLLERFPPLPGFAPRAHHLTITLGPLRDAQKEIAAAKAAAATSSITSPAVSTTEVTRSSNSDLKSVPVPASQPLVLVEAMFPREGDRVELEVFAFAQDERVSAVKVNTIVKTYNAFPHITISISSVGRAKHSNELTSWKELEPASRFIVRGTVKQFSKWAVVSKKPAGGTKSGSGTSTPNNSKPIAIGQLLKTHRADIQGKQIGASVQLIREWLRQHPVEGDNLTALEDFIRNIKLSDLPKE